MWHASSSWFLVAPLRVYWKVGFITEFVELLCSIRLHWSDRLLKTLRQPTTGFALLGAHQVGAAQSPSFRQPYAPLKPKVDRFHSFACRFGLDGRFARNSAESLVFSDAEEFYALRITRLLTRLLKTPRQPTTGFALLGAHQSNTLICKQIWSCERLTWNPAESLVCDVLRQLNVVHQAASC
ncbi:hypothetical protein T265_03482 [Opisthorchis viverrini]|uniref:Uncharacterized protein n=1 Tax=Opisthorchis viverrini TaxID=6198 RepID=A0A074ZS81_OPIVI|nr:hypothetical protein T265_03482 [Opisthorchis viverrini]KER30001.1 hypothetical protein T265_03482 [Opisthorchis viverrini]